MARRAKHKAHKRCREHLNELETAKADIRLMSELIERVTDQKWALQRQVSELRKELGSEPVTQPISLSQIRAQMRETAPEAVPVKVDNGDTMMLPVGKTRARNMRRPSWAIST